MKDKDIEGLTKAQLKEVIRDLRDAIREHRDQHGHDRCWLDDLKLYSSISKQDDDNVNVDGIVDGSLPPQDQFLAGCKLYWEKRSSGVSHEHCSLVQVMKERDDAVAACKAAFFHHQGGHSAVGALLRAVIGESANLVNLDAIKGVQSEIDRLQAQLAAAQEQTADAQQGGQEDYVEMKEQRNRATIALSTVNDRVDALRRAMAVGGEPDDEQRRHERCTETSCQDAPGYACRFCVPGGFPHTDKRIAEAVSSASRSGLVSNVANATKRLASIMESLVQVKTDEIRDILGRARLCLIGAPKPYNLNAGVLATIVEIDKVRAAGFPLEVDYDDPQLKAMASAAVGRPVDATRVKKTVYDNDDVKLVEKKK